MNTIKLLQVVTDLSFVGGDHVYVRKLMRYLTTAHPGRFEIHVAEVRDHGTGEDLGAYDELLALGVQVHSIKRDATRYLGFDLPRFLADVISENGIDIVHSHIFAADLAVAACRAGSRRFLEDLELEPAAADLAVLDLIIKSGITDLAEIYLDALPGRGPANPGFLPATPSFQWISTKHLGALKSICQEQDLERLFGGDRPLWDKGHDLNSFLQRFVSRQSDVVVTISAMANALWTGTARDVRYIPVACIGDLEWAAIENARQLAAPRRAVGTRYAFVGRLARKKNPLLLIEAFKEHLETFPDDELVVVGDGRLLRACKEAAEGTQRISFKGHVPPAEVIGLLAEVDAICLFSSEEGLPLVVQESMASSVPVLASRAGGIPDLVRHRESGFLVDEVSAEAIVETLAEFSGLDLMARQEMARAARRSIEAWISEEEAFESYVLAYHDLLRGRDVPDARTGF
ncbi:glycosyltransferase family 4 protein [Rhizobium leguminosarum]|uniref:glycosyltransferase family 4 protein n=1 Tax=Rhizobium leguminosarum TaxID=384 RepID=UPI001F205E2B|nr:glycosyltransferase family 4 protein [Rhizobium leguminosarum]UIJ81763.1 glycosyltransferase family 4 protein [Rhizobium leguminosarum]